MVMILNRIINAYKNTTISNYYGISKQNILIILDINILIIENDMNYRCVW
jgi:hypothetical protein